MSKPLSLLSGVAFLVLAVAVQPAQAYLDPGSGSMILQVLLAGAAGILVAAKLMWGRIRSLFRSDNQNR